MRSTPMPTPTRQEVADAYARAYLVALAYQRSQDAPGRAPRLDDTGRAPFVPLRPARG